MSARDDYPALASFATVGSINGRPHQTETGKEFARALDEIDKLHEHEYNLAAIIELHCKTTGPGGMTDGYCAECDYLWPCRTVHIASGWGLGDECYADKWCVHVAAVVA